MSLHPCVVFSVKHNVTYAFGMVFGSQMESVLAAAHDFLSEGSEDVFVVFLTRSKCSMNVTVICCVMLS